MPFWVAAPSPANLDRLVRFGRGWIPIRGRAPTGWPTGSFRCAAALAAAGRDPDDLGVQGAAGRSDEDKRPDLAATMAGAPALLDAGATVVHVGLQAFCADIDEAPRTIADLARAFSAATG